MIIYRPSKDLVESYVGLNYIKQEIPIPTKTKEEWDKSHSQFVLRVLLPSINPPLDVWRITAEAYLTTIQLETVNEFKTFEQLFSDGSTLVPDLMYKWGNIKDPWGVMHDWIYVMHKLKLTDVYDKKWTLLEAHDIYRKGWLSSSNILIGNMWYIGLVLGGWVVWNKKKSKINEPVNQIIIYG